MSAAALVFDEHLERTTRLQARTALQAALAESRLRRQVSLALTRLRVHREVDAYLLGASCTSDDVAVTIGSLYLEHTPAPDGPALASWVLAGRAAISGPPAQCGATTPMLDGLECERRSGHVGDHKFGAYTWGVAR